MTPPDGTKKDLDVLFPEQQISGYSIRPWSLKKAVALSAELERFVSIVKDAGIFDVLLSVIGIGGKGTDPGNLTEKILVILPGLIPKILPLAPRIISVTIDIPEEEAGELDLGTSTVLLLAIVSQNVDYLKNFFGPGKAEHRASA